MAKPTWSGQIQISLVSIGVKIFPATNSARQVEFHQIDRKTGKRIHHQNIAESGSVDEKDIVKGFEYTKGKYIQIEPDELKQLRIPTASSMEIMQFVKIGEISPELIDRPYFVAPKDDIQAKALAIMRKGLAQTGTMGIGEIAFSGREHLVAIAAPPDPKQRGLMLYTLRYEEELREPSSEIGKIKEPTVDSEELSLAKQLIDGRTSSFDHAAYRDDYEAAVRKLVDAKRKNKPIPVEEPDQKRGKVINLMDALRQSLAQKKSSSKPSRKRTIRRVKAA